MRHLRTCLFIVVLTMLVLWTPSRAAAAPELPAPADWPLDGTPPLERDFDRPAERWGPGHRGVDLGGTVGDPVRAAAAGTVTFARLVAGRGVVVVDHGAVRTTYEPVAATVTPGTVVQLGTIIGHLRGGGHCLAVACLHWGLLHGEDYLDPLSLFSAQPVGNDGPIRLLPDSARARAKEQAAARKAALAVAGAPGGSVAPFAGTIGNGMLHPVPGGVTSVFGMRFHPVLHVWKLHDGLDFGAPCGTPIRAPAAGVVTEAYFNGGYGHRLMVDHGTLSEGAGAGHRIVTGFNHATHYVVSVGTRVRAGQVLGFVGSTGYSTGCHLHLMVWRDGALINPAELF